MDGNAHHLRVGRGGECRARHRIDGVGVVVGENMAVGEVVEGRETECAPLPEAVAGAPAVPGESDSRCCRDLLGSGCRRQLPAQTDH